MTHIVLSGLPGSGKSTLANQLAQRLGVACIDKDAFLDALFATRGIGDPAWRAALSREADESFKRAAQQVSAACLVSWWRHPNASGESGTPTTWLASLPPPIVEVHCVCPVDTSVARFLGRARHPGHLDHTRASDSLREEFASLATLGPLRVGPVYEVRTDGEVPLDPIAAWLRAESISFSSDQ